VIAAEGKFEENEIFGFAKAPNKTAIRNIATNFFIFAPPDSILAIIVKFL
jgi:hypothetical protein